MVLNSGEKLDSNNWTNLSSVLNKVDISGDNLNINGKFSVNGKICDINNICLGDVGTEGNPGQSCLDLYNKGERENKAYYLIGTSGKKYQVYCDMITDGGGWTLVFKVGHAHDRILSRSVPTDSVELSKFSSLSAETPNGTLIDEFISRSTQLRFQMPTLDQAFLISKLEKNDSEALGNRSSKHGYSVSNINVISGGTGHPRVTTYFGTTNVSSIYDYNPTWTPPSYGRRGSEYSFQTGAAYVYLK